MNRLMDVSTFLKAQYNLIQEVEKKFGMPPVLEASSNSFRFVIERSELVNLREKKKRIWVVGLRFNSL